VNSDDRERIGARIGEIIMEAIMKNEECYKIREALEREGWNIDLDLGVNFYRIREQKSRPADTPSATIAPVVPQEAPKPRKEDPKLANEFDEKFLKAMRIKPEEL